MDESIAEARQIIGRKVLPPRFIVQATLRSMRGFSEVAPAQNPLVTAFAQRIQNIEGLSSAQRSELQKQATRIVTEQVYPSWHRAIALLEKSPLMPMRQYVRALRSLVLFGEQELQPA